MKIASIVGARPQFIKTALISKEIRKKHTEILIHTGQHYDIEMSDIFFKTLNIPKPEYNLGIRSGKPGEQTGKMIISIETVLKKENPDWAIVYGDTNSTIAGALAAVKLGIPVVHVEAGLRSFNRKMPEEINRVLTDHISKLLFCPTKTARDNLRNEGITEGVHLVGDVMYEIALEMKSKSEKSQILKRLTLKPKRYLAITVHRVSNTDNQKNLKSIVDALINAEETIVFPVHPRTLKFLKEYRLYEKLAKSKNVIFTPPLDYFEFQKLLINSRKVLTDSGGVQKEAYFFKVPCITLREDTEWPETVKDGWNILVGANEEKISNAIRNFKPTKKQTAMFGDGKSAQRIVHILESQS